MQTLRLPTKVYFKTGSLPVALRELSEVYQIRRALLISSPGIYRSGMTGRVERLLRAQGIRTAEYFNIGNPPSTADCRRALPKLEEFQPDVIIGIGGEDALSAAKALYALQGNPGRNLDLGAVAIRSNTAAASSTTQSDPSGDTAFPSVLSEIRKPEGVRLVLIATDFASGAQNSPFAVLCADETPETPGTPVPRRIILNSFNLLPEISITDADLLSSSNPEAIRKWTQEITIRAVCAYAASGGDEYTDSLLVEALCVIREYSAGAIRQIPEALEKMHNAASLIGTACGNTAFSSKNWRSLSAADITGLRSSSSLAVSPRIEELAILLGYEDSSELLSVNSPDTAR